MTANYVEKMFEENQKLIKSTIHRNHRLLTALGIERDDAEQELSIAMLSAINGFDPERSDNLAAHITCKLQYAVLDMKRQHKPHGMTGVPQNERVDFLYMDALQPNGLAYELPDYDDTSGAENAELFTSLTVPETEALELKMSGYPIRKKAQKADLASVSGKYAALYKYENEGRIAA